MAQLVVALSYKPEGRGFHSLCCHWYNPSSRTMALGSTHPLTEMSTRSISCVGGLRRPVRRADNLNTFMCRLTWNLGVWTYRNPQGLSKPLQGLLYIYLLLFNTVCWKDNLMLTRRCVSQRRVVNTDGAGAWADCFQYWYWKCRNEAQLMQQGQVCDVPCCAFPFYGPCTQCISINLLVCRVRCPVIDRSAW